VSRAESDRTTSDLTVVICTYDNPMLLDQVLLTLARQSASGGRWNVLVVDNNSAAGTKEVLRRHLAESLVPHLRVVEEPTQGLTPARLRGVQETNAPWIAFVDDDCVLDEHWVENTLAFLDSHPDCGGLGGRVVPTYVEEPPEVLARRGWAFAEQDHGDVAVQVHSLVGAGMVLSRTALDASGWSDAPFFADRVGGKLISGGDVEIALRVAGTGRALWYEPACQLRHVIPRHRTTMPYLLRITRGLGVSSSLASALTWHGSPTAWAVSWVRSATRSLGPVIRSAARALGCAERWRDVTLSASFEFGRWVGFARVAALLVTGRCRFLGGDRPNARVTDGRTAIV
jgi:GT2 family glycosyltransferase